MIFKLSAMVTILFFEMGAKLFTCKTFAVRTFHGLFLHSKAVGPIRQDRSGRFTILTPFGFEAEVKCQIQHLEKIPGP